MSQKVPNAIELEVITTLLTPALTLRIYGNNHTPADGDATANYTEIAGGGYTSRPLTFANWNITAGTPTRAQYNTIQVWTFTGPVNVPGTIFGIYITRNSDNKLMWAERFPSANVPFVPEGGSIIRYIPKFTVESQF